MGYSDSKFYTKVLVPHGFAVSLSTATASGAINTTGVVDQLEKFKQRTEITAIRLRCTTAPNAASTALKASFLNGTNTFGTAILTTATAGQYVDAVITSQPNAVFAADGKPSLTLTGTATASGAANGSFDLLFEQVERPA